MDEAAFDDAIAVDLKGVFLCMKYEIGQMLRNGGGAIVNNASIAGMIADPGISPYVAAKHGVIGLSKAAALEYASKGIRINALAPGLVETAMTKAWFDDPNIRSVFLANSPMGRVAQPEEMAGMVLFLCSDFASFATGSNFCYRRRLYCSLGGFYRRCSDVRRERGEVIARLWLILFLICGGHPWAADNSGCRF